MKMSSSFSYKLSCGSGNTECKLEIEDNKFTLSSYSRWMCDDPESNYTFFGWVKQHSSNYFTLYTDYHINNLSGEKTNCCFQKNEQKISMLAFRLVKVGDTKFDIYDSEHDGMVMGGSKVNTKASYSAIMTRCKWSCHCKYDDESFLIPVNNVLFEEVTY
jgi:hypothetical protein